MTVLALCLGAVLAGSLLHLVLRRARARGAARTGGAGGEATVYETAFLAGGPARVADAVLYTLLDKERITVAGGEVTVVRPVADDAPEREVLRLCEDWQAPLARVRAGLARSAPVQEVGDRLAGRGLLWRPELRRPWRLAAWVHAFLSVDVLGAGLVLVIAADRPDLVWLPAAAALALGAGLVLAPRGGRLTTDGQLTLLRLHRTARPSARLALGGAAALTDPALRAQFAVPVAVVGGAALAASVTWGTSCGAATPADDGGSGASCGGDGGSCGGGCGGCGGCGG